MQAIGPGIAQAAQLGGGVLDARTAQGLVVALIAVEQANDRRGQRGAAHEDHARDLVLAHERHDAAGNGRSDAGAGGQVAEAEEVLVVKEELRHKELRACVLLLAQVGDVVLKRDAGDMAFGIGRRTHAEAGLAQHGNDIGGVGEIALRRVGPRVAAQSKNVLDAGGAHLGDFLFKHGTRKALAGEVRHAGHTELILDKRSDRRRGAGIARAASRVGYRDERRIQLDQLACDAAGLDLSQVAPGRKNLKRQRLVATEELAHTRRGIVSHTRPLQSLRHGPRRAPKKLGGSIIPLTPRPIGYLTQIRRWRTRPRTQGDSREHSDFWQKQML